MHQEVEIQVKIKDPKGVEKKLRKVGKFIRVREQTDRYFIPPGENFFARKPIVEYLRVRNEAGRDHLNYSFLHFRRDGWLKVSDEYETLVGKPGIVEEIFRKLGFVNKITVVKMRKYFDCGRFEVTLDRVRGLGNFMEVEAKNVVGSVEKTRKSCEKFLKNLGVKYEVKADMGYPKMLYRKLKRQGK